MAERRMFSKTIIDSDVFLDMPLSTQALYFHLSMRADDDGFLNNAKKIQRIVGASDDDLKLLIMKRYIITFDDGIIVVKHWRMNNYLRKDRYTPTVYQDELAMLKVKENGAYTLECCDQIPSGIPNGNRCETQYRLGKVSIGKDKDILSETEVSDDASLDEQETLELFDDTPIGGEDKTKDDKIPYKEIIDYLNEKIGSQYRYKAKSTKDKIHARYSEGFTFDDFKAVIDFKHREWGNDPKMCKFLRPETLFGTKFESYLNQRGVEENAEPTKPIAGTKDKYGIPIL